MGGDLLNIAKASIFKIHSRPRIPGIPKSILPKNGHPSILFRFWLLELGPGYKGSNISRRMGCSLLVLTIPVLDDLLACARAKSPESKYFHPPFVGDYSIYI
jgi:hypothetical protein